MSLFIQRDKNQNASINKKHGISVYEMTLFAMFGAMMFASKVIMELLPNVHLLSMFTILLTVVYRKKALIPIYIYVLLNGIFCGFAMWWIPYLYVWTVLWAAAMLMPQNMSKRVCVIVYPLVCAMHGFLFGTLYAPSQAIMFGLSFKQTIAWIVAGLPYDAIHGVSNFAVGFLIYPLSVLVKKLNKVPLNV